MNIIKRAILCIVHPFDCYDIIKRDEKKFKWFIPIIFYVLATAVNYSYLFYVHFPLSIRDVADANILLEAGIIVFPHFSWVIASYAITAIMDGESTFMQQFEAATYALVPVIVFIPLLGAFSLVLTNTEAGIYTFLYSAVFLMLIVYLFLALMILNDYTFLKAILVTFLSILAMIVMWCVLLLLLSLTIQLFTFFSNLYNEFEMKTFV